MNIISQFNNEAPAKLRSKINMPAREAVALESKAKEIVRSRLFKDMRQHEVNNQDPMSRLFILNRLHDEYGDHPLLSFHFGVALEAQGDTEAANDYFFDSIRLLKLNAKDICKRSFGNQIGYAIDKVVTSRLAKQDIEGAKQILSMMPVTTQYIISFYKAMARIHFAQGNHQQVIDLLFNAYFREKEHRVLEGIAFCQTGVQQHRQASITYKTMLEHNPQDARIWYPLGRALLACNQRDEAVDALRKAYQHQNHNPNISNDLAYALAATSRWSEAIRYANEAINQAPDKADYHDTLAFIFLAAGDNEKAMNAACKAISLDWHHSEAWYHLGLANCRLGNIIKAYEIFNRLKTEDLAWAGLLANELPVSI